MSRAGVMLVLASAAGARVVDRYSVRWSTPAPPEAPHYIQLNQPSPPSGAFVGNGDVSLLYAGNGTNYVKKHTAASMDWQQWLYMSKNDMVRACFAHCRVLLFSCW